MWMDRWSTFFGSEVPKKNWPSAEDLTLVVEREDCQSDSEDWRFRETRLQRTQSGSSPLGQHWCKRAEKNSSWQIVIIPRRGRRWSYWSGSVKDNGKSGCGVVIKAVDRERWVESWHSHGSWGGRSACSRESLIWCSMNVCVFGKSMSVSTAFSTRNDVENCGIRICKIWTSQNEGVLAVRRRERPYCRQTCSASEVFRKCPGIVRAAPSLCFLLQCKIAWTTRKGKLLAEGAPPQSWAGNIWHVLADGSRNSDRDERQCTRALRVPWRGKRKKGLLDVMTGRTWPDRGLSHRARATREYVLLRFWQDCVADRFGHREVILPNALGLPKSVFACAMTVMDKVEGLNEEEWVGSRLAACMWIYTKAVLCDGHGPTQENLRRKLSTIMESVSCVCEDAFRDHEWVTELNVIRKENEILAALNYDLDVPCVIQWRLLWFSSLSRLNHTFLNNGSQIAKYHKAVNRAIDVTFTMPFEGLHTPRTCLLRSVSVVLYMAPDKDWNVEEEMKGGGLRNVRASLPATMAGTTTFPMREDATGSPEDAAPLFLRCVLCSLLLIETEAEIVTESFGIILRLDWFASLLFIPTQWKRKPWAHRGFGLGTDPRRQGWMARESMFWEACSGRCHWKALRID